MNWVKLNSRKITTVPVTVPPALTAADLSLLRGFDSYGWFQDTDNANLIAVQSTTGVWNAFYGVDASPAVKSTGYIVVVGIGSVLALGDWLRIGGRFYQFVANTADVYAGCVAVLVTSTSQQSDVQAALVSAITNDSLATVTAVSDATIAGRINFTSVLPELESISETNDQIVAKLASGESLELSGMAGAPAMVMFSTQVIHRLGYENNQLTGFTPTMLLALVEQSRVVLALFPKSFLEANAIDAATGNLFATVDCGETWTHLPNTKCSPMLDLIPPCPLVRNEVPSGPVPNIYNEMTGYDQSQDRPKPFMWAGPMGLSTNGNAGASDWDIKAQPDQ